MKALVTHIRVGFLALCALGVVGMLNATAQAATITWGTPTTIAGDSDVSTAGTLLYADNVGASTHNYTVNGVTFVSASLYGTDFGFGANTNSLPSGGSSNYKSLLDSFDFTSGSPASFNLTGLTAGNVYEVQIWAQDARGTGTLGSIEYQTKYTAGNSVVLTQANNSNTLPGQFVIGTFIANATTQSITVTQGINGGFGGGGIGIVNALEVRTIPEPSSAILLLLGAAGLWQLARRRRK